MLVHPEHEELLVARGAGASGVAQRGPLLLGDGARDDRQDPVLLGVQVLDQMDVELVQQRPELVPVLGAGRGPRSVVLGCRF